MAIRNRVKRFEVRKASELLPNPRNWKTHPQKQLDAIRAIFEEVGFAGVEVVRELEDGSLMLIDGHARASVAEDADVPIVVLDVTEEEANKILLTFDPLSGMAKTDDQKLEELLREVQTGSVALAQMLEGLAKDAGVVTADGAPTAYSRKVTAPIYEPKNVKPGIGDLVDRSKSKSLIAEIDAAEIPEEEKAFLRAAAFRHDVFDYELIADYYAHSNETVKRLMEKSALVIIDFDKAIEEGYTDLSKELAELYRDEYPKAAS